MAQGDRVIYSQPDASPTERVPKVWGKVPPQNKNFTGRTDLLARLRSGLANQVTAVLPHALHGLGGVGKTQMAVEYAYRYRSDYDLVWWIPADQPVLVRSSLASLAQHLGLPSAAVSGVEDAANAVLDALRRGEPYSDWLLIFDNADEPEELTDVLPQGPGHVLITSRNHRWAGIVDAVPIDVFTREESVEFLTRRVPRGITPEDADRLAEELGDLPLALEQAGALQTETGIAVSEYLRLLTQRTSQLLSQGKPTEYPVSMTAAWALSVASLEEKLPEALDLLRYCAFFGPEPIPRDAFSQVVPGLSPQTKNLIEDPIRLGRAIGELGRFALARLDIPARTIQVHRLIQALVRDELPEAEQGRLRHEVHILLAGYTRLDPSNAKNWPTYLNALGHLEPAGVAQCQTPEVRELALNMITYLYSSADYPSARSFVRSFLDEWTATSGADNEDVLNLQVQLANLLRELGQYEEAAERNVETLNAAEKVLGTDHDTTLRALRGRAADLRASGDFQQAHEVDEEALRRYRSKFEGERNMDTWRAVNSVALDYGLKSDYANARTRLEQVLREVLAKDGATKDPAAYLNFYTGLVRTVRLGGDYSEACDLGEDVYAFGIEQLGPEHAWTLRAGKDLSIAWRRAGDYDRALELAEEIQQRYVRIYGLDHPDTLAAAVCLANIRRTIGEFQEALVLADDTVRRYPRIYAAEHPYNHACAGNLAVLRRITGDPEIARKLNEDALAGLEVKLGRDHHYSLTVAINLASDLAAIGETESAYRLCSGSLRRLRALLGDSHPLTLSAAANTVADLRALGRDDEASALYNDTEERYRRTLTLDHPDAQVFLEGRRLDADFDPPPI
ncbi:FxSxx-COOH system tetratricopeptide repeat protein [Actinomadura madurae]|uniref:FxSxx-COOH system tetratricopeptide repeat protein n=3 Tax=Actinomadura madurae TaxID=1993 RepID=UPI0020263180|nr:FxSxx-COOH system tetratricopeptide repeat protein [Actinomadura madurae]MCP9950464.1 FxSxx-COOH system tetratricopeptide repeat protein [Actinomadura madurae]MCP9967245.1 FxSxx-COOH system tetratricopeptide repeat protein [Actinomadura madurae]MCQ0008767.1 FxSxx-COOH system tetratricopeptide repeat protein [Actinomadura madurae]URM96009.1 FxSxx-COOH system tetratricopeptide repeat protein [Actinomadura madurae]